MPKTEAGAYVTSFGHVIEPGTCASLAAEKSDLAIEAASLIR